MRVEREVSHVQLTGRGALPSCVVADLAFIIYADEKLLTIEHSAMSIVDTVNNISDFYNNVPFVNSTSHGAVPELSS